MQHLLLCCSPAVAKGQLIRLRGKRNSASCGNTGRRAFPTEEDEASAEQSQADDMPPREGMARSRLTGEWVDEDVANTRPIAVMIPNSKTASYYGLSKAGVLYECNVEATMTRLMAILKTGKAWIK